MNTLHANAKFSQVPRLVCKFKDSPSQEMILSDVRRLDGDMDLMEALSRPVPTDFYELLALDFEESDKPMIVASTSMIMAMMMGDKAPTGLSQEQELKAAYRRLQKLAHPDIAGDAATEIAALLNLAYATLSDPQARQAYDEELRTYRRGVGTYDGRPVSSWRGPEGETRALFIDETTCIGCMQCAVVAPDTFFMEEEHGRARVHTQWGDDEEVVKEAVGACPVDCIHYVEREQLPLLEYVMKSCKRECVALMGRRRSGNMGSAPANQNPFVKAESFIKKRKYANIDKVLASGTARLHDEQLSAAISQAWLALPDELKRKGWPQWAGETAPFA